MRTVDDIRNAQLDLPHVVLTIGSFDGVHRGHQRILSDVVRAAREAGGTAVAMTMCPHPREFFSPQHAPNLLTNDAKKLELLEEAGIDVVCLLRFDSDVANLDPVEFVEEVVHRRCGTKELIVGHDFRFGKGAAGDYHFLTDVAPRFGLSVRQVEPLLIKGERVSSTVIRERVLQGDLDEAELFLGRKYSIVGEIVTGRGIGTSLGYPTANVRPCHSAVPAHGVYAAEVLLNGAAHLSAVNIGIAPTIRNEDIAIEAFLIDFSGDIIGRHVEIVFHRRLRPEKRYPTREALVEQIGQDVTAIREYFGEIFRKDGPPR